MLFQVLCCFRFYVVFGSSNPAHGTWGDFGQTTSTNPYWKNGGTTTAGSLFNQVGGTPSWYPAYGYRISNSGTLNHVATYGYYWSASPCADSSTAQRLYFHSPYVSPASGSVRSHGFPVRCVQE